MASSKRSIEERIAREEQKLQSLRREANPRPTITLPPVPIIEWQGCYNEGWKDLITPTSFAHPAKAARGLMRKIYDHLFELGAITKGSIICDPFGGIGTTAIEGAWRGCRVISCELEPRFVEMHAANLELHREKLVEMGLWNPMVIQGDSRQLRQHVQVTMDALVSSPPYSELGSGGNVRSGTVDNTKWTTGTPGRKMGASHHAEGYGETEGQLGLKREGVGVDAVISSPPYAEIATGAGGLNTKPASPGQQGGRSAESASQDTDQRYGETEGQLSRLDKGSVEAIISSPPYVEQSVQAGGANAYGAKAHFDRTGEWLKGDLAATARGGRDTHYGKTEGQLSTLDAGAVEAVISSPPYAETLLNDAQREAGKYEPLRWGTNDEYGTTAGQLGALKDADGTFWEAARDIVAESYALLKPGGYAVWIVKAFVRDKKLVDFPGDWRKLCEYCGFETLTEVRALLVKEVKETNLFGEELVETTERKSFFRRLAEKKGSPKIDFEVIWIMRKK